jgi:hypothetical protein
MEYTPPRASLRGYDHVVSIGNKCPTAMMLRELGIYGPSFPFDPVPTTPALVLKYIQDPAGFVPSRGSVYNADGVWFGHFDVDAKHAETAAMFQRRFERLFRALRGEGRVLLVYTAEADVYNEMGKSVQRQPRGPPEADGVRARHVPSGVQARVRTHEPELRRHGGYGQRHDPRAGGELLGRHEHAHGRGCGRVSCNAQAAVRRHCLRALPVDFSGGLYHDASPGRRSRVLRRDRRVHSCGEKVAPEA